MPGCARNSGMRSGIFRPWRTPWPSHWPRTTRAASWWVSRRLKWIMASATPPAPAWFAWRAPRLLSRQPPRFTKRWGDLVSPSKPALVWSVRASASGRCCRPHHVSSISHDGGAETGSRTWVLNRQKTSISSVDSPGRSFVTMRMTRKRSFWVRSSMRAWLGCTGAPQLPS